MTTKAVQYAVVLLLGIALLLHETNQETIDDIIAGASKSANTFDLLFDESGNSFLQELDMILTKAQYHALQVLDEKDDPNSPNQSRKKRKAVKALNYRWKNNVIPYRIAQGVFSSRDRTQIDLAINEWKTHTCLVFREATRNDNNLIYLNNGGGCYSYVGMTGGSQTVGLAPGCRVKGVIAHEIGHAVGFHHEQNRPDRDNHVRIMRDNIPPKLFYNFKKYPWSAVSTYGVPYDYGSVMHYGGTAFSTNGQYTIRTIDPKDQRKIGNRLGLSFSDIKLANLMYKCSDRCANKGQCPNHGFMDKNCNCLCPGSPVTKCSGTTGPTSKPGSTAEPVTVATPKPTCKDMNKYCKAWAQANYCGRNTYVKTYCKVSCNLCSGSGSGKGACRDLRVDMCPAWSRRGYCSQYSNFMSENCAKTCKTCTPNTNPGTEDKDGAGNEDKDGTGTEGKDGPGNEDKDGASSLRCPLLAIFICLLFAVTGRFLN